DLALERRFQPSTTDAGWTAHQCRDRLRLRLCLRRSLAMATGRSVHWFRPGHCWAARSTLPASLLEDAIDSMMTRLRGYRRLLQGLGPLNEREFRLLYLARAFSLFGDGLVPVALPFAVFSIDRSPSALGFVLASRSVSLVVFLLVAGVVADRLPRKQVMIASDLVRLTAQATMAALLIGGAAKLWQLVVLVFLYGLGDAFFRPTSTGFVPETVSRNRLQQANALLVLTNSSFSILGPVVAGVLVASVGPGWALAADAATFLASALFVVQIHVIP